MLNKNDLYTQRETTPIYDATGSVIVGKLIVEYEVRAYSDVRNLGFCRAYLISCKQRVVIPHSPAPTLGGSETAAFENYPAAYLTTIGLNANAASPNDEFYVVEYSPKTINSSISSSLNASKDQQSTFSGQYTTGSSTSVTNSYEVGGNLGFSGKALTGGGSGSYGHSTTYTRDDSYTKGASLEGGTQTATSDTMSIKDWASYGYLDNEQKSPSWLWGQEYPWNVLEFYRREASQKIILPDYVQQRLVYQYQGADSKVHSCLLPPSNLSLYGINFVSSARWLYSVPDPVSCTDTITFTHAATYYEASHSMGATAVDAKLVDQKVILDLKTQKNSWQSAPLNLAQLGLDPIQDEGLANGAIVGFVPSQFMVAPKAGGEFKIASGANNVLITGTGFESFANSNAPLSARIGGLGPVGMSVEFKIADSDLELTLFFKHWKKSSKGCILTIVVNENPPITRHVDSFESGNGTDNVTRIILRHKDYTSPDFYDYLVMGLNKIAITYAVAPDPAIDPPESVYVIRALAIG